MGKKGSHQKGSASQGKGFHTQACWEVPQAGHTQRTCKHAGPGTPCGMEAGEDPGLSFLPVTPFCCPDPRPHALPPPAPMVSQRVPPGPCWGLAILRALHPTPVRGTAEGNTFLIVSLPFMGCQGAEAAAPRPFPLARLCLFSFPPALLSAGTPTRLPH